MRQAGYLAAAGIYALDHHIQDLARDNRNALLVSAYLEKISWVDHILPVKTNIIIFYLSDSFNSAQIVSLLKENGIQSSPFGSKAVRLVFHRDISDTMMDALIERIQKLK